MKLSDVWKQGSGEPPSSAIPVGGLAIDSYVGKAYSKKSNGEIFEIGSNQLITYLSDEIDKIWASPSMRADVAIAAEINSIYLAYLGREADAASKEYWIQEVNFGNVSYNDLEYTIYVAAQENGETLLKIYETEEQVATRTADLATVSSAENSVVSTIRSWYSIILHNYNPDNAGLAYWIREVNAGRVLLEDIDEAIFNAAFGTLDCYAIPDTLVDQYELGTNATAQVKTTATLDDLVVPVTYMGEVTIVNGNIVVAADADNIQAYIAEITANPTRAYIIVSSFAKYFNRNMRLDGVHYWMNDTTSNTDLERAIFVAGSMNGEVSTGVAYAGTAYTNMISDLQNAVAALQAAQASGNQTAINTATSVVNTAQTVVSDYSTATQVAIATNPTRAEAISEMYSTYLGRPADDAGLAYWINDSLTLSEIEAIISQGER